MGGLGFGGGGWFFGGPPPPGAARAPVASRATRARILASCIVVGEAGLLWSVGWMSCGMKSRFIRGTMEVFISEKALLSRISTSEDLRSCDHSLKGWVRIVLPRP